MKSDKLYSLVRPNIIQQDAKENFSMKDGLAHDRYFQCILVLSHPVAQFWQHPRPCQQTNPGG